MRNSRGGWDNAACLEIWEDIAEVKRVRVDTNYLCMSRSLYKRIKEEYGLTDKQMKAEGFIRS